MRSSKLFRAPSWSTPDLCDLHSNVAGFKVLCPSLRLQHFGANLRFSGPIVTVQCFEDNSKVKKLAATPGMGQVMVVDGAGSTRKALLGDQIAANAVKNGWAGFLINGMVRDVEDLGALQGLGVLALGSVPLKTEKLDKGSVNAPVSFGNVTFEPGHFVFCDRTGVVVSEKNLVEE